jgi:hypothetical protein
MQKDFCFQNLKPTSKEILFSKGKLIQVASLSCKNEFRFKKKIVFKVAFGSKSCCLKQNSFHKWLLKLALRKIWHVKMILTSI